MVAMIEPWLTVSVYHLVWWRSVQLYGVLQCWGAYMKIAKAGQATIKPAAPANAAILPAVPDRPHTEFLSPVPSVSAHVLGAVLRGVRPTGVAL